LEFELILKMRDKDGTVSSVSLGQICRAKVDGVALLGLELSESKQVLTRLQREIVTTQFKSISHDRRPCACCATTPSIKDYQNARFRGSLGFGADRIGSMQGFTLNLVRHIQIPPYSFC
jgi:hypothetical protein